MSLATRTTVERALAAYVQTITLGGKTLADFTARFEGEAPEDPPHTLAVHCMVGEIGEDGELPEEWTKLPLPALVVSSPSSQPNAIGYDLCDVELTMITTPIEVDAPSKVQERTGWLSALFHEDNLDIITAALNPPASGPDTRPVQGITIIGLERNGENHATNGLHVMDTLRLRVHACGTA